MNFILRDHTRRRDTEIYDGAELNAQQSDGRGENTAIRRVLKPQVCPQTRHD